MFLTGVGEGGGEQGIVVDDAVQESGKLMGVIGVVGVLAVVRVLGVVGVLKVVGVLAVVRELETLSFSKKPIPGRRAFSPLRCRMFRFSSFLRHSGIGFLCRQWSDISFFSPRPRIDFIVLLFGLESISGCGAVDFSRQFPCNTLSFASRSRIFFITILYECLMSLGQVEIPFPC